MTITATRVFCPIMGADEPFLDRAAVAEILDVHPTTVTRYLHHSRPGGLYEATPFPAPDGRIGGRPWWRPERADDIRKWASARPGSGLPGVSRRRSNSQADG